MGGTICEAPQEVEKVGLTNKLEPWISRIGDFAFGGFLRSRARSGTTALILHSVTEAPRFKIDVSPSGLRELVGTLRQDGCELISIQDAARRIRQGGPAGVTLTFDDGYKDFLELAAPILAETKTPATVSVVPKYVTSQETFDFVTGTGRRSMSWDELKRLLDRYGEWTTIANHSWEHGDYLQMTDSEVRQDVARSQEAFARQLRLEPKFFTYPYGFARSRTDEILLESFDCLLTGIQGINDRPEHARRLRRIPIFGHDQPGTIRLKASGAPTTYGLLRRFLRNAG